MHSADKRRPGSKAADWHQSRELPQPKQVSGLSKAEATSAAARAWILFVDDQPALADLGQQMLERLGYQAHSCTSGAQALRLISSRTRCYDLLISDMSMPGMTGLELAAACLEIRPELKVIICTGHDAIPLEQDEADPQIPIAALMNKPIGLDDLADAVRGVLKHAS